MTDDDRHVKPFNEFLREQSRGRTHDELSENLYDLTAKVIETGKAGMLTLKLKVQPMKNGDGTALVVSDEIVLKLPEHDRSTSLFYAGKDGNLQREDPNQLTFDGPLREAPNPYAADDIKEAASNE